MRRATFLPAVFPVGAGRSGRFNYLPSATLPAPVTSTEVAAPRAAVWRYSGNLEPELLERVN
jgi:hypothetical protein